MLSSMKIDLLRYFWNAFFLKVFLWIWPIKMRGVCELMFFKKRLTLFHISFLSGWGTMTASVFPFQCWQQ